MSYDFEIVVKKLPEQAHITEFILSHPELSIEGKLHSKGGNPIVNRRVADGIESIMEIWGPDKVEAEDLDDIVARTVKPPCWLVRITVPAAEKDTVSLAEAMSIHIAQRCGGAVYDPQAEAMVWPKVNFRSSPLPRNEAIRVVDLGWYLPPSQSSVSMAQTFLRTTGRLCPQALPVRFGVYHPLQGKLRPGDEQPFLDAIEEIVREGHAEMLELKSKTPCLGGTLWFPSRRNDPRMSGTSNYVDLKMSFDGRVVESDSQWCERIVSLFIELAANLKAFYGHGYVERGVFASRRGLGYGAESEHYPTPAGRWRGIPSVPYWLNWFGGPYFPLLEGSLRGGEVSRFPNGVLARFGSKPMDLDGLRNSRLSVPLDLVSEMRRAVKETRFPSGLVHRHEYWETNPAKFVPDID